ncbi:MAG: CotH kinase family protein, partial [Bacteroidota bacterium]
PATNKYPLKIKTNKYVAGKKYDGIKEFTLHMNFHDPTMLREKLNYEICADLGLYSLRTAFAKVYINNIYWGLFTIVEGKDEMYKQVFDHRDMDAVQSLDFGSMCYISNNPADYDYHQNGGNPRYELENGSDATAWPRFVQLIDLANNTSTAQYMSTVEPYFNLRDFFTYQAANVYLMNFDSYIGFLGNQIYVFDTLTNRWEVTPWDFNASFGLWDTNNSSPTTYPLFPSRITSGCVAEKMNDIPQLRTWYLDAMCTMMNTLCDTVTMNDRIDELAAQIRQAVYDDTRKVITNQDFENGLGYGYYQLFWDNQPALKSFMAERYQVISQGLIAENYNCPLVSAAEPTHLPQQLTVYPNPASTQFAFELPAQETGAVQVRIFNTKGQVVHTESSAAHRIDVETLPAGIYFLQVQGENGNYQGKFLKQ